MTDQDREPASPTHPPCANRQGDSGCGLTALDHVAPRGVTNAVTLRPSPLDESGRCDLALLTSLAVARGPIAESATNLQSERSGQHSIDGQQPVSNFLATPAVAACGDAHLNSSGPVDTKI